MSILARLARYCPSWALAIAVTAAAADDPHWAFQPLGQAPVPRGVAATGAAHPIDAFIRRKLHTSGLTLSERADRNVLIRRASLDLTGLPPTPEAVAYFLEDTRDDAFMRLVDRLLASPHYGERWARDWLDLCHYADTDGYLTDQFRPYAWRYRDWLIGALNADVPFDRFTIDQLAGDLLPGSTIRQKVATGLLRQTLSNREGGADLEEFRTLQVVDRTAMLGAIWLGLTVQCAQCHDHKYDPVSQREYYQLYAFFNNADELNIDAPLPGEHGAREKVLPEYQRQRQALLEPVGDAIARLQARWEKRMLDARDHPGNDHRWDRQWELLGLVWGGGLGEGQLEGIQIIQLEPSRRTDRQRDRLLDYFLAHGEIIDPAAFKTLGIAALNEKLTELKTALPQVTRAPVMCRSLIPRQTHVHVRGDFRAPGRPVIPDTPAILPGLAPGVSRSRLGLARWLVSPAHPLTARVAVNRIWQALFDRGLVSSPANFGRRGAPPTHPELLDWLSRDFLRGGWSVKRMHRRIVSSATYQQSSAEREEPFDRDPDNRLLARQNALRLTAEQIRDSTLLVSGLLYRRIGGPSVRPPQPSSVADEGFDNRWDASEGADRYRRGLYTFSQRTSPFAMNTVFDGADPSHICPRRERSNTPLQALSLLNDPVFFEAAEVMARRVLASASGDDSQRIGFAFRLALARSPNRQEADRMRELLDDVRLELRGDPQQARGMVSLPIPDVDNMKLAAWTAVCSVCLNLHEFITRD